MRLIDADNALELFRAEYQNTENLIKQGEKQLDSLAEGCTEAAHIIKHLSPTVDAVPVVRCKDCIYTRKLYGGLVCKYGACSGCFLREDFFCANGTRKETRKDGDSNG